YRAIETAVGAKHSQENPPGTTAPSSQTSFSKNRDLANASPFLGVTVQPMVKLDGYELIIGSSVDPQFGPVLLFGSGGQLVEVFKDRALALPPLNTTLARRLMEQTRIHKALKGVRGRKPVDLDALEQLLVRFSQLVVEQKWIKEIDINPLLAAPPSNPPLAKGDTGGLIALDARVVIHDKDVPIEKLPRLAIRPYPTRYIKTWTAKNGMPITFRPIRPEDEPLMIKFHETLSDHSVYLRYLQPMLLSKRVAHERLARICFVDYDRELAMVAEGTDPKTGERVIMVAGRLSRLHEAEDARLTVLVNDAYQGIGLGKELVRQMLQMGRHEKIRRVSAVFTPDNTVMHHLCEEFGARFSRIADGKMMIAEMDL
ncbi:partial Peptidyl-lysine N-acetyltransferase Pat, partial [Anaerolineae bacterium]